LENDNIYIGYKGNLENVLSTQDLIIKGMHNVYNSMAAILTAKLFNISNESIRSTLYIFKGVEHRLEFVREFKGIKFFNDSKATNVDSVWFALQGFKEPIVLILGGRDKGNDYNQIKNEVNKYVKKIIAVGESKEKVYNFFNQLKPVEISVDFNDAVVKAFNSAAYGDVVLLSPACASFDQFENYEQRGTIFKELVNAIKH
jgi:UDP-N-acetylmuramoylalanine--D-glutamate ligase